MATTDDPQAQPPARTSADPLFIVLIFAVLLALSFAAVAVVQRNDALTSADARATENAQTLLALSMREAEAAATADTLRAQVDTLRSTLDAPTMTPPPTVTSDAPAVLPNTPTPAVTIEPTAPAVIGVDHQATAAYALNIALEIESYAAMLEATATADRGTLTALTFLATAVREQRERAGAEEAATLEAARTEIGRLRGVVTQEAGRAQTAEAALTGLASPSVTPTPPPD